MSRPVKTALMVLVGSCGAVEGCCFCGKTDCPSNYPWCHLPRDISVA